MLDEEEFKRVILLRKLSGKNIEDMFGALLEEYERITGHCETNGNAVFHQAGDVWAALLKMREAAPNTSGKAVRFVYGACRFQDLKKKRITQRRRVRRASQRSQKRRPPSFSGAF
jgi:hypothetical protein